MKSPAILFYTGDFLNGCVDLTMEERGQYITLLCLQHQKGRLSEKTIKLAIGTVSKDVLDKFQIDENGLYYNERMEEEIIKRQAYSESRAKNRCKKDKENICKSYDNDMNEHMENENINENININDNEIINKVIDYLNNKCKTRYRANTNDVKKHLLARIREGYTYEDFVKVIDKKYDEWYGTEYEKYLRPATLFGNKFQSYLNQPERKKASYGNAEDCFEMAWRKTLEEYEEE